jgi:chromate transporter
MSPAGREVPFAEALGVWTRVACLSFGGPAGQIAVMHRILVEEKRWIDEGRFLHALNYCMLLPGPEAQQLATYCGWLLHGTRGGLAAGGLFILPGFLSILALSCLYVARGQVPWVSGLFLGLQAAVLAIVAGALLRLRARALTGRGARVLALAAFTALFFLDLPFPLVVLGAGLIGMLLARLAPGSLARMAPAAVAGEGRAALRRGERWSRSARTLLLGATLWLAPVALLVAWRGEGDVFADQAIFFSKAAVVTFGGAYSVLAYIAQQAVERFAWLQPDEMIAGLGMAESTPGPLIQVVQFVGFLGAFRGYAESPWTSAVLASVLVTWVTFAPCFLWIFLGAPYVEGLRGRRALDGALSAITAAVVGVIANLALWMALHGLFARVRGFSVGPLRLLVPEWRSVELAALVLTVAALVAHLGLRQGLGRVLVGCAVAGMVWRLVG